MLLHVSSRLSLNCTHTIDPTSVLMIAAKLAYLQGSYECQGESFVSVVAFRKAGWFERVKSYEALDQ